MGSKPMVHITEPQLIRQILADYNKFQKPKYGNPLASLLGKGLVDANGDQWAKHRKIINPAFHVEKLKMINKWEGITKGGSIEVDVYPHLQTMTSDVISQTAFGSSYEEGRKIFELQHELAKLVVKAMQSIIFQDLDFCLRKDTDE
ncbi:putative 11-oxo-beta-amyrin 30-oxidase [Helianthus annuus]|nr:putative 11-oxo-beta-amyrin 30-oxidase [Helianthus annuus]